MIVLVIIFLEFSYSLKYYIAFYKIFIGTKDRRGHASVMIVSPDLMLRLRPIYKLCNIYIVNSHESVLYKSAPYV
jgi:hypothetical protein